MTRPNGRRPKYNKNEDKKENSEREKRKTFQAYFACNIIYNIYYTYISGEKKIEEEERKKKRFFVKGKGRRRRRTKINEILDLLA